MLVTIEGNFGLVGPLFLLIALDSAVHRAVFIHTALRAEGTVIEMRPTHSTRTGAGQYIPVFRYTADDGRVYIVISDVSVRRFSLSPGEQVRVLYQQGHPENARIDAFTPLWLCTTGRLFLCFGGNTLRSAQRTGS